jgi:hypothetical protein
MQEHEGWAMAGPQNAPMACPLLIWASTTWLSTPSPFMVVPPGAGFGLRAPRLGRLGCIGRHSSGHTGSSLSRRVRLSHLGIGVFSSGFTAFSGLFGAVGSPSTADRGGSTPLARPHGWVRDPKFALGIRSRSGQTRAGLALGERWRPRSFALLGEQLE